MRRSGALSSPNSRSKSPRFSAITHSVAVAPDFGERRALAGVVAAVEFAVGALEVVLVEAALVDLPPVVADLEHMQVRRLVPGGIRPTAPVQIETLTPHRQNAMLEVAVLLEDSRESGSDLGIPVDGVAAESPTVVIDKTIRHAPHVRRRCRVACIAVYER